VPASLLAHRDDAYPAGIAPNVFVRFTRPVVNFPVYPDEYR